MRTVVVGAGGMLGRDVAADVALTRAQLDVTDREAVRAALGPDDLVVNCAAWTDVDGAESAEPDATAVNGTGAGNLAAAAAEAGALLVHVSSDYVFDGRATDPYEEDAPTAPQGAYGRSKLAGERAIAAAGGRSAIVRTAWVFGPHGKNFVDTMRRLGAEREEIAVVDDQVGCPTYTGHLAPALIEVADRGLTGVLHVAGGGRCTWFDLAEATFAEAGIDCRVKPQSTADLGRPAPRPAFSVLRSTRGDAPALPPWRDGLKAHLARVEVAA
jgi:dTDP-4-dehydrorhamnose reductase